MKLRNIAGLEPPWNLACRPRGGFYKPGREQSECGIKTFTLNAKVTLLLKWNEIEIRLFKKINSSFVQATGNDKAVERLRDCKG